jgi:alkyl hydroperoxide reductase subunit F
MKQSYDLIIIGGSAAATAAGVYAARRNLNFKILTKEFGGEVATSGYIENWPGIIHTDGIALAQQFKEHLHANHAPLEENVEVTSITKEADGSFAITAGEQAYTAKAVILSTGAHPRPLGIPGEKEFRNKGVTYCTTCDGPLFQGRVVTVVGGGNSALESVLMLCDIATKVYVINKNKEFKGEQVLIDKMLAKPNVEVIYDAMTNEVVGEQFVTSIKYTLGDGTAKEHQTDGVFVHVGMMANSSIAPAEVQKNAFHEILVDANCATNMPGFFAAGDVTNVPFKQIVIAAGMGCTALLSAVQYLNKS